MSGAVIAISAMRGAAEMPMRPCFTVSIGFVSSCTAGVSRTSKRWPPRSMVSVSGCPAWARIFSCSMRKPSTLSPSTATIRSPYCTPACAAGEPGFT